MQYAGLVAEFVDEAKTHIDMVQRGLLDLEAGTGDADTILTVFRALHSIAGAAGYFRLENIAALSGTLETMFGEIRDGNLIIDQPLIKMAQATNNRLQTMVADIENSEMMDISQDLSNIAAVINGDILPVDDDKPDLQADETPDELPEDAQPVRSVEVPAVIVPAATPSAASTIAPPIPNIENQAEKNVGYEDSVRVHVSLLNDLLNLASEMVLGRNQLLRTLDAYRKQIPGLNAVLQNVDGITTELQEKIMQTRMQPIGRVFNRFPRIIRELSKKTGKDIALQMEGFEVELDKSIIEALGDPLTHLIRNAIDHGIETPEARERAGKLRTGVIILKAYHEGGYVNIDISDDGGGIDVEKVREKALAKGIVSPGETSQMGERELLALLLRPGFSTADRVTDLSGRGVGLDVVKTNVEKLGGVMEIETQPGRGTSFRLTIPLTLAIIPSLIVEAAGQKFALPQVNLKEMVRVKAGDPVRRIETLGGAPVLRLRETLLPVVHLAHVLSDSTSQPDEKQIVRILVIRSGSKRYGLVVDRVHDGEEILVKQLPKYLNDCQCYSGVTILGDGRVAMILDVEGICTKAGLRFSDEIREKINSNAAKSLNERQSLLLFKCSGPETFSIDLAMVARVEKIRAEQIEIIGDKEFIQFRGEGLRVIRPEDYLPVNRGNERCDEFFVIIPKLVKHPLGILIHRIEDTMDAAIEFNREDIKAKGLVGTTILHDRIILVINIYELFEMADPEHYPLKNLEQRADTGKKILLAEDTPFFAKLEKKYLEGAGYQVVITYNGKEAWETLQEHRVDAVVTDVEMPLMDGIELVKRIRADKSLADLPVVAVTSKADDQSIMKGLEAGFDFYEIKLDKDRLLEKVRLALQKRTSEVG